MKDGKDTTVVQLFEGGKNKSGTNDNAAGKGPDSPFIDLPPGVRMEIGLGCVFLSLSPQARVYAQKNWSELLVRIEQQLVAAGYSYEILTKKNPEDPLKRIPDVVRIRAVTK